MTNVAPIRPGCGSIGAAQQPNSMHAPQPFGSTEAAWLWAWQMLEARRDGAGVRFGALGIRPCEPDDVIRVLDRLYRDGKVTLAHAHILRIYGERQRAPNADIPPSAPTCGRGERRCGRWTGR